MLFNSWQFAVFLLIVFAVYWFLPEHLRNLVLLAFSFAFYMSWRAKYIIFIISVACITYCAGLLIEKCKADKGRKFIFAITGISCIGILLICKYFDVTFRTLEKVMTMFSIQFHPYTLKFVVPLGISFFTLQGIGYISDVYHKRINAEKNIIVYFLFISFFPQLSSGPIARAGDLIPQLKKEHVFSQEKAIYALSLIIWGLFKKMFVADNFSVYVDRVYSDLQAFRGIPLMVAVFMYSVQIYCDFSGYTDIARGAAGLLGIDLKENFKAPYLASSVKEFWTRWHISLSSWLKDYVYIPLGGNRKGKIRTQINIIIVFVVSGIWHGTNITYLIWGLIHAFGEIAENILNRFSDRFRVQKSLLKRVIVFFFISFAWIFFRSDSVSDAVYVVKNVFVGISSPVAYIYNLAYSPLLDGKVFAFVFRLLFGAAPVLLVDVLSEKRNLEAIITETNNYTIFAMWLLLLVFTFMFSTAGNVSFVYFQF